MADETNNETGAAAASHEALQSGPLLVHAQYVKDLSFENPHAPDTLRPGQETPEMHVNVGLNTQQLNDEGLHEVVMHIEARATRGSGDTQQVVFVAELDYAILASAENISERQRHPVLMIEAPKLAFPFARQILSEVTAAGGYPPVLLNPIDFEGLYIQQSKEQQAKEA